MQIVAKVMEIIVVLNLLIFHTFFPTKFLFTIL